jgi:hypothetical protein
VCWQNTPNTPQYILPMSPNRSFVWDVFEKEPLKCPLSMFRYIIFAILWKFLTKTLLLTNLQIIFVYIISNTKTKLEKWKTFHSSLVDYLAQVKNWKNEPTHSDCVMSKVWVPMSPMSTTQNIRGYLWTFQRTPFS